MTAPISQYEEDLVHDFIIRTYLLEVLEKDIHVIEDAPFKLNETYIHLVENVLKKARVDLRKIKDEMKQLIIKVAEPKRSNVDFIHYDYFVRGYHSYSRYWDAALKIHGTRLLEKYFKGVDHYKR